MVRNFFNASELRQSFMHKLQGVKSCNLRYRCGICRELLPVSAQVGLACLLLSSSHITAVADQIVNFLLQTGPVKLQKQHKFCCFEH